MTWALTRTQTGVAPVDEIRCGHRDRSPTEIRPGLGEADNHSGFGLNKEAMGAGGFEPP